MTYKPVTLLNVFYEPVEDQRRKVGRLALRNRQVLFEYDAAFIATGLELSPFKLPLRPGVVVGDPARFAGLSGVFDDSLPDGWGRLLIDRRAAKLGMSAAELGPLDRLALSGARTMGALVYEPQVGSEPPSVVNLVKIAADAAAVLRDADVAELDRLIALGGTPHGARPKALVQISDDDGAIIYGERKARPGCTFWIVKFPSLTDDKHAGALEHVYYAMAAKAGITVPRTRMVSKGRYLALERFDRAGTRKIHMLSLAGLLNAPHTMPTLTYRDLLLATRQLTRDERAVTEMFRRACFNVFAHNRDDHTRNFAFLMSEKGEWRPSPAFDLTLSDGPGGEHAMLIGREGRHPGVDDLLELARSVDLKRPKPVIEEVRAAVGGFRRLADKARLPKKLIDRVATAVKVRRP